MVKLKKILFVVGLLVVLNTNQVKAQENIPNDLIEEEVNAEKGSIQIILTNEKEENVKEGIEFQCTKVAELINGEYSLVETYQNMNVEVNTITYSNELDEAARRLAEKEVVCETKKTDSSGCLQFTDLDVGLYLLKAKESEFYGEITPTLVAVPTWNEIKKEMEYNVTVMPKHAFLSADNDNGTVQTGDYENVSFYLIVAGLSVLVMSCFGIRKRKKYNGQQK